jgi:phosphatidylglycerol:prolipoprotein diacylglycerol transferase
MRPVLFTVGRVRIWSYPALLYLGLTVGMVAQNYAAHVAGLRAGRVYLATLVLIPIAVAGARLWFVASHWRIYRREPVRIWRHSDGGLAMYGALPAMLLCSLPTLSLLDVPFWAFWDVSVFCILVGMIFTRVGCLMHGCCAGRATRGVVGFRLPDHRAVETRRIPSQLLEAGWAAVLLAGAILVWPRLAATGELFLLSLAGYALGRFAQQPLRASRGRVGTLDIEQTISIAVAALAMTALLVLRT